MSDRLLRNVLAGMLIMTLPGFCLAQNQENVAPAKITISGWLYDGENKLLNDGRQQVFVFDVLQNQIRVATFDKKSGKYSAEISPAALPGTHKDIGYILYYHPDWHSSRVAVLSTQKGDLVINKVLPNKKGPEDFIEIIDQLETYEFLRLISEAVEKKPAQFEQLENEFKKNLEGMPSGFDKPKTKQFEAMSKLPQRQQRIIRDKARQVYKLYDIAVPSDENPTPPQPQPPYYIILRNRSSFDQ